MMKFSELRGEVERGIRVGEHVGAQLAVAIDGETVLDIAVGMNKPFQSLETDQLMLWLSACKPVGAVAAGILMDRGLLDLDRPVADWIPEFGNKRKESITPRHLLTHTAGIRGATLGWTPRPWEEIIGMICYSKPEPHWLPGETAGYHVDSAWYLLGELVRRIDGRSYDAFVREEIFLPLDMPNCWVGLPDDLYEDWEDRIATMYDTSQGGAREQEDLNSRAAVTACRPGGNGRGPAREFLNFYQAMLTMIRGGEGILKPETARNLVSCHRQGLFDKTFRHTIDWGLGFMRQSDHYAPGEVPYQFGSFASVESFGHGGNQSTVAFCDPEKNLCAVILFNGMPGEERHQARMRKALDALYRDLGFRSQESAPPTTASKVEERDS